MTRPSAPAAPVEVCATLDRPTARVDRVASALTGCVLEYVSPAPLGDLLSSLKGIPRRITADRDDQTLAFALLPFSGLRGATGAVDCPQAIRTGEIAFGHAQHVEAGALDALARAVDPKNTGLREQIIFSGARSASTATHVYAPHDDLPARRDELVNALRSPPAGIDPYLTGVVCGYFTSALHPYLGGNGRWSRLVAAQAARRTGSSLQAVLAATFLAVMKEPLARHVWPRAVTAGLREYVALACAFEEAVHREFAESAPLADTRALLDAVRRHAPSNTEFERTAISIAATNRLDPTSLKARFGLSARRLDGLLAAVTANRSTATDSPMNVDGAWERLSAAASTSLESIT